MAKRVFWGLACAAAAALMVAAAQARSPVEAARVFLETLPAEKRAQAAKAYEDPDRLRSRYTPGRRGGLSLKDMTVAEREAAFALVDAMLSAEGRALVDQVIERERILGEITDATGYRDPTLYYLAVFGEPGGAAWSVRFEGHHLSLNLAYRGATLVSATPYAVGSNPERTDWPGAPPVLLGPLVEAARTTADGPEARRRFAERLFAPFPAAWRDQAVDELIARGAFAEGQTVSVGFQRFGGDAALTVETRQTNHIHLIFQDFRRDFGVGEGER